MEKLKIPKHVAIIVDGNGAESLAASEGIYTNGGDPFADDDTSQLIASSKSIFLYGSLLCCCRIDLIAENSHEG